MFGMDSSSNVPSTSFSLRIDCHRISESKFFPSLFVFTSICQKNRNALVISLYLSWPGGVRPRRRLDSTGSTDLATVYYTKGVGQKPSPIHPFIFYNGLCEFPKFLSIRLHIKSRSLLTGSWLDSCQRCVGASTRKFSCVGLRQSFNAALMSCGVFFSCQPHGPNHSQTQ